ncbi:hypothetical protein FQN52_000780 [Onygenales sp. PD_12]|nr:hypothetical protein FQN52_000780 [Onygenales sp. PD_12]
MHNTAKTAAISGKKTVRKSFNSRALLLIAAPVTGGAELAVPIAVDDRAGGMVTVTSFVERMTSGGEVSVVEGSVVTDAAEDGIGIGGCSCTCWRNDGGTCYDGGGGDLILIFAPDANEAEDLTEDGSEKRISY